MTTQTSNPINNLSPLDGRYAVKMKDLQPIFSEYGLIKFRLQVEIQWFKALCDEPAIEALPKLSQKSTQQLDQILENFTPEEALKVKAIEKDTNHDVKAVEYYLKQQFLNIEQIAASSEFIHFACTSEDINNLAYALMLKTAKVSLISPGLRDLMNQLLTLATPHTNTPMMARTHGQPASPTTLGKELVNVVARLQRGYQGFQQTQLLGKINGAVGNFNAHYSAFSNIDWPSLAKNFVESLGLDYNPLTTQIEPHDWISSYLQTLVRINNILIDFNRDAWGYISLGYFVQKSRPNEVGSSTMPHKVNPIDFENSEGNLGIANALLGHLSNALPVSRFQRDLTDSTRLRNLGVAIGHAFLAYQSTLKGLTRLSVNKERMALELDQNWALLAEPIQTVMRRYGIESPYEKLKAFTRGKQIDQDGINRFIAQLDLPDSVKQALNDLRPENYLGNAKDQAEQFIAHFKAP